MQSASQPLLPRNSTGVDDPYSHAVLVSLYPQPQQTAAAVSKAQAEVAKTNANGFLCHLNSLRLLSIATASYSAIVEGLNTYSVLLQQSSAPLINYVVPAFKLTFLLFALSTIKPIALGKNRTNSAIYLVNALLATSVGLSISKIFQPYLSDWNAENITFALGLAMLPYGLIHDFTAIIHASSSVKASQYLTAMAALAAAGLAISFVLTNLYNFWAEVMMSSAIAFYLCTMTFAGLQITNQEVNKLNVLQSTMYFLASGGAIASVIDKFVSMQVGSNLLLYCAMALGALAEFCLGYGLLSTQMAKKQPNQANTASVLRSVNSNPISYNRALVA